MVAQMKEEKPDVVILLGDMDEILFTGGEKTKPLFGFKKVIYVLGNHDLYSPARMTPPNAFNVSLLKYREIAPKAIPLQTSWTDETKTYTSGDFLFLGTMGFPDLAHPKNIMPASFLNRNYPTIDATYMNLDQGWLAYSSTLIHAFAQKLELVDKSPCSNVIISTHYGIFEEQAKYDPNDEGAPYFFCYRIGHLVRQCAERNPNKTFHCISAHSHEYARGQWFDIPLNVRALGLKTTYCQQDYVTLEL